ncbi:hypothetical protein PTKIN_Ptkin13bG0034400 [Pterospermum kingtungense]
MCNAIRMKRGFTACGDCSLCRGQLEDINHVLRKCKAADGIWRALLPAAEYETQKVLMFGEWQRRNLLSQVCCDSHNDWQSHFAITLWWLWRWRNERVFSTQVRTMESQLVWLRGQFQEVRSAFQRGSLGLEEERMYITRYLRWIPPEEDWVKLNTDGCSKIIGERAACGGLFRDQSGIWLGGFMANLGRCGAMEAELWGILFGLRYAWEKGYKWLILEVDTQVVANWLVKGNTSPVSMVNLLSACRYELSRQWEVKIGHVYREQNCVADHLALMALHQLRGAHWLDRPPPEIDHFLQKDREGFGSTRRVLLDA